MNVKKTNDKNKITQNKKSNNNLKDSNKKKDKDKKKNRSSIIVFITFVIMLLLIKYFITSHPQHSKHSTININLSNIINKQINQIENKTIINYENKKENSVKDKEFKNISNINKKITIDCYINSKDKCYVEGETKEGWLVGIIDKKIVEEINEKYGIKTKIIEIINDSKIIGKNVIIDNEDLKQILKSLENSSKEIEKRGIKKLNVSKKVVITFEKISLRNINDEWYWEFNIILKNGTKLTTLIKFDLED